MVRLCMTAGRIVTEGVSGEAMYDCRSDCH